MDGAVHICAQRFGDAGRRREIHVGDPHRDAVGGTDPGELGHHVPFRRVRAAAVDDAIEIKHRNDGS